MIDLIPIAEEWPDYLFMSGQVIVGQRWPHPRWFLGSSTPPSDSFVVADGIQVVADGDTVVAPS